MKLRLKVADPKRKKASSAEGRRSLRWIRRSGLMTFLVFLALSFGFWFLQSMQNDVVRRIHIPLAISSLNASQGTSDSIPEYIELEVQDKGIEHIRYAFNGLDSIKLSAYGNGNEYIGITAKALSEAINARLSPTAKVLQQSFHQVRIGLYRRVSKRVPVSLAGPIRPAGGFTVSQLVYSPDSITIYGERRALDSIRGVRLEEVAEEGLRQPLSKRLALVLPRGVYSDQQYVSVDIHIEELTEQTFTIPINILNPPSRHKLILLPSTATVHLTLPRSRFSELTEADVEVSVDYSEAPVSGDSSSSSHQLQLRLTKAPVWVVGSRIQPESVQYVLEAN